MKVAAALLYLVAVACSASRPHKKSSFRPFIYDPGFQITYSPADALGITSDQFDRIVDILLAQIDSGYTEAACDVTCIAGAATILGDLAPIASTVCHPFCSAALAKLEEVAG